MCNLYTLKSSPQDVAKHFGVASAQATNAGEEVYPGTPGMVVREADGQRMLQSMIWGFPVRLKSMKPESKPKPVNNIADLAKSFWVGLARKPQWRCIIPVTAFAEAEGVAGSKTRTWFTVKDQPIFGWGGLWRDSDEWGPVYSGAMTDCNDAIRPVHDRMPVLLLPHDSPSPGLRSKHPCCCPRAHHSTTRSNRRAQIPCGLGRVARPEYRGFTPGNCVTRSEVHLASEEFASRCGVGLL